MIDLTAVARALAKAYPPTSADKLFTRIGEDFQKSYDSEGSHSDHMHDAIADLASRGRILHLILEVRKDPDQIDNQTLLLELAPATQDARWDLLDRVGLVLTGGPFVNRTNLKSALDKLFMGRRVLKIGGSGAQGRSWSRQLITRRAGQRRARYYETDLRTAPPEARSDPKWLADKLRTELFPQSTPETFFKGLAENRLVEAFVTGWVPGSEPVIVAIDHLGDDNLGLPVRDFVIALAHAVAGGGLQGMRLVLIDGPPGLDLSEHEMHTIEDVVGAVSTDHFEMFFTEAAKTLFPGVADLQPIVTAAMAPITPLVPTGINKKLALAVRDSLEAMAMEQEE